MTHSNISMWRLRKDKEKTTGDPFDYHLFLTSYMLQFNSDVKKYVGDGDCVDFRTQGFKGERKRI
jgi:hypothetical protein